MALYQESLDANRFRLASISIPQKGEPPSITLTTHHLADDAKPQYHGLSYTWGPPRRDIPDYTEADCRKIFLNGHAVNVVPNLYEAIIQLDKSRPETPVWIDALCINQTDLDERHAQVSSMDRIYGGAYRVLIWLGAPTPELKLGLKVADRIGDTAFEESKRIIRTQKYDFCPSIADMQARYNLTPFTVEEASGLITLYESSWFGRIWVIQEVALDKRAEILCDDLVIPFDKVGSTAAFLHLSALLGAIVTVLLVTTKPNIDLVGGINLYQAERIQLLREWCKGPRSGWLEVLPFIDFTAGIHDESLINTGPGHQPSISMVLLKLLLWTSGFRASDSRDSIYGLGGILQHIAREQGITVPERLRPNYTISAAEVLQTVASEILEATGDLTLLTLVQDPAKRKATNLPSWCPDFPPIGLNHMCGPGFASVARPDACGLGGNQRSGKPLVIKDGIFSVPGFPLGSVEKVGESWHETEASLHDWVELVLKMDPIYPYTGQSSMEAFWRTLIWDQDHSSRPARLVSRETFESLMLVWLAGSIQTTYKRDGQAAAERSLQAYHVLDTLANHIPDSAFHNTVTLESVGRKLGIIPATAAEGELSPEQRLTWLGPFRSHSMAHMWLIGSSLIFRRPILTGKGHLGCSGESTKVGDEVWIVSGCPTPLVLRKQESGDGCYSVISESYVHGVMNGEAITNDVKWRTVTLV